MHDLTVESAADSAADASTATSFSKCVIDGVAKNKDGWDHEYIMMLKGVFNEFNVFG